MCGVCNTARGGWNTAQHSTQAHTGLHSRGQGRLVLVCTPSHREQGPVRQHPKDPEAHSLHHTFCVGMCVPALLLTGFACCIMLLLPWLPGCVRSRPIIRVVSFLLCLGLPATPRHGHNSRVFGETAASQLGGQGFRSALETVVRATYGLRQVGPGLTGPCCLPRLPRVLHLLWRASAC